MKNKLIAWDLGTGGVKASLFDAGGASLAETFRPYDTFFPREKWVEQRPLDWWEGVCAATASLLEESGCAPAEIACAALSGHSLVAVPLDREGRLLSEQVPIWCDMRASDQIPVFFRELSYEDWYLTTGNGDPPETYTILKLMWMKAHQPELFGKIHKIVGSKDFVNYKLTGRICTDPSYASGFGVFNLKQWDYEDRFFAAAGIDRAIFPEIVPVADPGESAYALSKAALVGLTKALAIEFAPKNIRVNCTQLGYARTPMAEAIARQSCPEDPESALAEMAKGIPVKRLASPDEVGELFAFLGSDESSYITGSQFVIDGAATIRESNMGV